MQTKGYVSLWAGVSPNYRALDKYATIKYTRNGDAAGSGFSRDFLIVRYDNDLREAIWEKNKTDSLAALLSGCSYESSVVKVLTAACGAKLAKPCNAGLLLYSFRYDGAVKRAGKGGIRLEFVGAAEYGHD